MEHIVKEGLYGISFEKIVIGVSYISPKTSDVETQIVEFRKDPLTDLWTRINVERSKRPKVEAQAKKTEEKIRCIFCKERIFYETPKFVDGDRYILGRSLLFPNKYPFAKYHGVIVPNFEKHITSINELTFLDLYNSLKLAVEYFKENYRKDKEAKYIFINLNHGFTAGASIDHLHFQIIQDNKPTNYFELYIKKSKEYFQKYKRFLIEDLALSEEKLEERFIYKGKIIWWFSSFAPWKKNEVIGFVNTFNISNMAENNFREFCKELFEFLKIYEKLYTSFNLTIFDPVFVKEPGLRPVIKIVSRPLPRAFYTNDTGFMEILHLEPVATTLPEETAKEIRKEINIF